MEQAATRKDRTSSRGGEMLVNMAIPISRGKTVQPIAYLALRKPS